jgi:hypothetical protein
MVDRPPRTGNHLADFLLCHDLLSFCTHLAGSSLAKRSKERRTAHEFSWAPTRGRLQQASESTHQTHTLH